MRRLSPGDYRRTPWKNGAGTTTELAISPPGADLSHFLWRVSIAEVQADGPFSTFPGCDRAIMLIEGRGMVLHTGGTGSIALLEPFQARHFSGDWTVFGQLVSGPVRDFNLIVSRYRARGLLGAVRFDTSQQVTCPAGATLVCHILKGDTAAAREGDTLVSDHDLLLTVDGSRPVTIVVARIQESA